MNANCSAGLSLVLYWVILRPLLLLLTICLWSRRQT